MFSCKQNEAQPSGNKTKAQVVARSSDSPLIGYENEDGDFVPVSDENLLEYYRSLGLLSDDGSLANVEVMQGTEADGTTFSYLSAHGVDGEYHSKIATLVTPYNGDPSMMVAGGTTCTCKSKNCTGVWDCNSSLNNGLCSCSPCSGENADCEKTSTTSSAAAVRQFFVSIGVTAVHG